MSFKTAEEILETDDIEKETVECPEWGCSVIISVFSIADKESWARATANAKDEDTATSLLVAYAARNEDGTRLFRMDQIQALKQKSSAAMERLARVAARINKLRMSDQEEAIKN